MTARDVILREMGLTPVWRTRSNDAVVTTGEAASVTTAIPTASAPPVALAETLEARSAAIANMSWSDLRDSIASCSACSLSKTRTHTVPGVGDLAPSWMVIGEAPGENEDKQGEPFVGKAGQLLDAMLSAVGKKRGDGVFIANVIKCRHRAIAIPNRARSPHARRISSVKSHSLRRSSCSLRANLPLRLC